LGARGRGNPRRCRLLYIAWFPSFKQGNINRTIDETFAIAQTRCSVSRTMLFAAKCPTKQIGNTSALLWFTKQSGSKSTSEAERETNWKQEMKHQIYEMLPKQIGSVGWSRHGH
jgi:hypothetical protein